MLCSVGGIVVVGNRGIAAEPDSGVGFACGIELFDLNCADRKRGIISSCNCLNVELSVRNGELEAVVGIVSGQIDELQHPFCLDAGTADIAGRNRNLIKPLWQIDIESRFVRCELHGIAP